MLAYCFLFVCFRSFTWNSGCSTYLEKKKNIWWLSLPFHLATWSLDMTCLYSLPYSSTTSSCLFETEARPAFWPQRTFGLCPQTSILNSMVLTLQSILFSGIKPLMHHRSWNGSLEWWPGFGFWCWVALGHIPALQHICCADPDELLNLSDSCFFCYIIGIINLVYRLCEDQIWAWHWIST